MDEQIIVRVSKGGNVSIETKGMPGKTCMKRDSFLREGFGTDNVFEEKKTAEYYDSEVEDEYASIREY